MKWLFFSYSLPAEPSKARVYVWRQLKKLGAVNFQTVWVIPYSKESVAELNKLIEDIEKHKGEGLLIEGKTLTKSQEESIGKVFIDSRNEEYKELIEKCEDFFREIKFEINRKNFIFAEVEENEEELQKLKLWMKKIEKRDFVKAPLRKPAIEKIKECEKMFEDFTQRVYKQNQSKNK
ncbi:MAG: chromate resistance protein ChrB [Nitrospira sp.]|nr:chromate resistance protein ChrB [Nitrospira sp.]